MITFNKGLIIQRVKSIFYILNWGDATRYFLINFVIPKSN